MTAVGYIRRSKKAEESTVSIAAQEKAIRQFCDARGFVLSDLLTDDGISGRKRIRFVALNESLKRHKAKYLVVYHLDRLARDVAGLLDYIEALTRRGITVFEASTGQKISTSTPGDWLSTAAQGMFSEFFPRIISVKTASALAELRDTGKKYSSKPPFGYRFKYYMTDEKGREKFELIPFFEEQEALTILAKCRAEGLGARRARTVLLETGFKGRSSVKVIFNVLKRFKEKEEPSEVNS